MTAHSQHALLHAEEDWVQAAAGVCYAHVSSRARLPWRSVLGRLTNGVRALHAVSRSA